MRIRTVIITKDARMRERICSLLSEEADTELVGGADTVREGIEVIQQEEPALVLLDLPLAEVDGFAAISAGTHRPMPAIIALTNREADAVRAFEKHAADCLLKPFTNQRFRKAIRRAREYIAMLDSTVCPFCLSHRGLSRLVVNEDRKVVVIKTEQIDSIEAAGNYVAVHVGKESHILRDTLSAFESQLDPRQFLRISRSAIVNLDRVKELLPSFKGKYLIVLQNGRHVSMTRPLREVEEALQFAS